jgi:uncharacterized membrane protein
MAFCASCGAPVEGRFCAKCGSTSVSGGDPGPQPGNQPPPQPQASSGLDENVASALCYAFTILTGILFLVLAPYNQNRNIRFHAFQSIFFGAGCMVFWIAFNILSIMARMIATSFGLLFAVLSLPIWLAMVCAWLFLMYKAYNKDKFVIPVIGPLAEKQA